MSTYYIRDVAITFDATKLIFTTHNAPQSDSLYVLNMPDMDTLLTRPFDGWIEVSNTGAYIAVLDDTLTFLDGNTFEILFSDTGRVYNGRFLLDDSKFYTVYDNHIIRVYDMHGESLYTEIDYYDNDSLHPSLWYIQPSATGNKIYLQAEYGYNYQFLNTYYPAIDSTGNKQFIFAGLADLQITQDGNRIVATNPWSATGDMGSSTIFSINPDTDLFYPTITAYFAIDDDQFPVFDPGKFAITPDGRYGLFTTGPNPWPRGILGIVDFSTHEFIDMIGEGTTDSLNVFNVLCQKFLK